MGIKKGCTSFDLKLIALMSMLIDHFGAAFLQNLISASYTLTGEMARSNDIRSKILFWTSLHQETLWNIYEGMRFIGRLAFPMYCFLLVQGFLYTKDVKKYVLRLGIFALLSEIPFDLAFNECVLERFYNNVFFTLFIGLLLIWGISYIEKYYKKMEAKGRKSFLIAITSMILVVSLFIVCSYIAGNIFYSDYDSAGVFTIFVMYLLRKNPVLSYILGVFALTALCMNSMELAALCAVIPLSFYNGTKGKSMKYFFYVFYPAHLLFFVLLCRLLQI